MSDDSFLPSFLPSAAADISAELYSGVIRRRVYSGTGVLHLCQQQQSAEKVPVCRETFADSKISRRLGIRAPLTCL